MSAIAPATRPLPSTRRLEVRREQMVIEGHALEDVALAGYAARRSRSAPRRSCSSSAASPRRRFRSAMPATGTRGVVAGARAPRSDRSGDAHGARVRAGRATARRGAASTTAALPPLSALGLADLDRGVARRHRLHDAGDVSRREPRRARRHRARGAPSRARRAARHDLAPGCVPTAGAPRRATCSASSCATACAPATSRPAWCARASSAC